MRGLHRVGAVAALVVALSACQTGDPTYSTTESNLVSSPTPNVSFPTTQVGQTSTPITIQISPVGNTYNTITNITYSCSDFSVQAVLPGYAEKDCEPIDPCAANSNVLQCPQRANVTCGPGSYTTVYNFTATFHPNAPITSSCPLTVYVTTGTVQSTYQVTLNGTGSPPPLSATVTPTSLAFGDVRINADSSGAQVVLKNTGGATLMVSSASVSSGVFHLASGPAGAISLAPGQTQAYSLTCHPTAVGGQSGTFSIANNYTPLNVGLSCNGVDSNLGINPSPAAIAQARVGEPQMTTLSLVNSGGAPMTIQSVAVTGGDIEMMAAPAPGTILPSNTSAQTTVKFMATTAGDASGVLTVTYDGGKTRTATISARAVNTSMSISPSGTVDLGAVCVGQSTSKTFTVVANDQGPFQVQAITDDAAPAFTYAVTGLPAAVQPQGANMYTFAVTAAPTDVGPTAGSVQVKTDIPGADPEKIDVQVVGLAAGVNGTPSELYLGGVEAGGATVGQEAKVLNCSSAAVTLSNPRIEGDDMVDFLIVKYSEELTVQPNDELTWLIIAKPDTVGEKHAVFLADYDGGQVMVPLVGDGLGMMDDTPTDTSDSVPSYYSCAVGGSSAVGVWPLALAFGFMARRRRARH